MKGVSIGVSMANHAGDGSVHVSRVFSRSVDETETSSSSLFQRKRGARGKVGRAAREKRVGFDARFELFGFRVEEAF